MNTIKCFSLLIAGSLLSTALLAQNATAPVAELDVKPVVAKPIASNIPAPGARVVPVAPVDALKTSTQPSSLQAKEIMPAKADAVALPIPDASAKQAKMTDEMKATMAGKGLRSRTIDQSKGVTESKLTPVAPIKPLVAPVEITPILEN